MRRSKLWWNHKALALPIAASVLVHAAAGIALYGIASSRDLTDIPAPPMKESVLALAPEPPANPDPVPKPPEIKPPPAKPVSEPPAPAPPAPEPPPRTAPDPEVVALDTAPEPAPIAEPERAASPSPGPPSAPAGPPAPAVAPAPRSQPASFAGVAGDPAGRIVYVVDASGSMAMSLPFVREELIRSVSRLQSSQSFQVVVTREPPGDEGPSGAPEVLIFSPGSGHAGDPLIRASDVAAAELSTWLESIAPLGRSAPLAGLEAALKLDPDLVFLLSRSIKRSGPGAQPDVAEILAALDAANPRGPAGTRPAIIKAVQFVDEDPTGLMQAIAREHGGAEGYRVLRVSEFSAAAQSVSPAER